MGYRKTQTTLITIYGPISVGSFRFRSDNFGAQGAINHKYTYKDAVVAGQRENDDIHVPHGLPA